MASLSVNDVLIKLKTANFELKKPGWDNKGGRGQEFERRLGIPPNQKLTDLTDGELKTYTITQTIFTTQLLHCLEEIIEDEINFENSLLGRKLKRVIYVGFNKSGEFSGYRLIDLDIALNYKNTLKEDFNDISNYIRKQYKDRNELKTKWGRNKLLQIRTKASKNKYGEYTPLIYNGIQLKNKYMAFYLSANFGKFQKFPGKF